jgi:hypothetical protein
MEIKINGVYSYDVMLLLKSMGVKNFGFDLRPKSFNFIQLHALKDIIEKSDTGKETYSFLFSNEKDFVIDQLIKQIESETRISKDRILLEFTDVHDIGDCEKFNLNYVWHFDESSNYRKLASAEYLRVLSISQKKLEHYQNQGQVFEFIKEINELRGENTLLDLRLNWDESIIESINDFYLPKIFTLEINQLVESSYRNINQSLLQDHLNLFNQSIIQSKGN